MSPINHFLSVKNLSEARFNKLLNLAMDLKEKLKQDKLHNFLNGKSIGMIFEKPSNRTRISFEAGIYQLGAKSIYIQGSEIGMGVREPIADISRVLSRYLDAVIIRAKSHSDIEELARFSSIPIINGLSDLYHPCQAMADILTILEHKKKLDGIKLCYIGDGNNVCKSLILAANIVGIDMTVSCPKGYEPDVRNTGYKIIYDPKEAIKNSDAVYTDVWISMGQEEEKEKRIQDFSKYSVTMELINNAAKDVIFLHCLPAHRGEEVSSEVIESSHSVVFDQAENRLHAQKAILVNILGAL